MPFPTMNSMSYKFSTLLVLCSFVHAAHSQPPPGAAAYLAAERAESVRVVSVGDGAERAYVLIPESLKDTRLPVVVFLHGWLGMSPRNFGALLDHLARRGSLVIYPVYQEGEHTPPQAVSALAATGVKQALTYLEQQQPGLADTSRTLYYGFSMGASIALNFAAQPERYGVPPPKAVVAVAPGDAKHIAHGPLARSIIGPLEKIPPDLPVALLSGLEDTTIGVPTARLMAPRLCHLSPDRRVLLFFPPGGTVEQPVRAGHGSPGAPDSRYDFRLQQTVDLRLPRRGFYEASSSLNYLDFYGYWRVVTGMFEWVAAERYPTAVFGPGNAQTDMGVDADGRPNPPALVEQPCAARTGNFSAERRGAKRLPAWATASQPADGHRHR